MKRLKTILPIVMSLVLFGTNVSAQNFARMSERTIMGTARYVGMSGAMTAIGGDPSSVLDNPAGLGLYRRPEAMISFDFAWDRTWQGNNRANDMRRNTFFVPQASLVITLDSGNSDEDGVQFNNIMLSYHRLASFNRTLFGVGGEDASLGALVASTGVDMKIPYNTDPMHIGSDLRVEESGGINEFAIDWGINVSHRWYAGLGIHVQSYSLSADAVYGEDFPYLSANGKLYDNQNNTTLLYRGVGVNVAAGAIYRPLSWLRLGFSLKTPSLGSLTIYSRGTWSSQTDSVRYSDAPDKATPVNYFHAPLQLSTSMAFQIGYYGMIALQYDFLHQAGERDIHTLRAGLEIVPVPGMYINAGYAYESTFKNSFMAVPIDPSFDRQNAYFQRVRNTQYASAAIGYRGQLMIFQAAYQYRWQGLNLYAHENALPYNMNTETHRLVLTIGWHRGW